MIYAKSNRSIISYIYMYKYYSDEKICKLSLDLSY